VAAVHWQELFAHRIVVVSGKGGTGKSTVAAALAVAASAGGRRVLLAEVEGRAEVSRTLGVAHPDYREQPTDLGPRVLSITSREAALEYFQRYLGMKRLTRPLLRAGVVEQVIGAAPGFKDLLATGKIYEILDMRPRHDGGEPVYDLVVLDAPPTGQIVPLLAAPSAFAELIRVGRMSRQSASIERLFHREARVVLVTLPEEMAVAETLEAVPAIEEAGVRVSVVVANRLLPPVFARGIRPVFESLGAEELARKASAAGANLDAEGAAALAGEARVADSRYRLQRTFLTRLSSGVPLLTLPEAAERDPAGVVQELAHRIEPSTKVPGDGLAGSPAAGAEGPVSTTRRAAAAALEPGGRGLDNLLTGARIIVVCGSGGVGKTTISAAVAIHMAERPSRTILLTVDPARRLATALRLPPTTGERTEVRLARGRRMDALQLDTQRTFDELIERNAGTPERRDLILSNPFYRRISDTLAGTSEYMAMEKLYALATEEDHEAIVIDTPPTRSALSFLEAPNRMTDFLGGPFIRWLLWPSARAGRLGMGVARLGAAGFSRTIGRLIGAEVLADTVEFLSAFEGMYAGFKARAASVLELLRSPECAYLIVTAPTPGSLEEAGFFVRRLSDGGMRAAAVVANRWLPEPGPMPEGTDQAIARLGEGDAADLGVAAMLLNRRRQEPRRRAERGAMEAFVRGHPEIPVVPVPELAGDVHDVPGLRRVAEHLFAQEARLGR
jgi:anion-transporting  ArsA/GET3 family ATPase